jgi:protein gp37
MRFPQTFPNGFALTFRPETLEIPLRWRRPRLIFVNSMSDLFHSEVPLEYLQQVFDVIRQTPHHTYQILTKRAERLARVATKLTFPRNVWIGVSVESEQFLWRVDYLRTVGATVRFISAEPLLGSLKRLDMTGLHWVIAGGESQYGCRPADRAWFRELRDLCQSAGVHFFLKQLGGHPSKRGGDEALLDGRKWTQMPLSTPSDGVGASQSSWPPAHLSDCLRQSTTSTAGSPENCSTPSVPVRHRQKRSAVVR